MIATLKSWAVAILGVLAAIFAALMYREKALKEMGIRKGVDKSRDTERKAVDALTQGLANEVAAVDAARARRAKRLRERSNKP